MSRRQDGLGMTLTTVLLSMIHLRVVVTTAGVLGMGLLRTLRMIHAGMGRLRRRIFFLPVRRRT